MKNNIGTIPVLNAFWLKLLMLLPMVLDHVYYYLYPRELLAAHYIARVVAPVFGFLTAQSMRLTRRRERYIARLFAAGGITLLGNLIITMMTGIDIPNNIFFSLGLGAAMVYCVDKIRARADIPLWAALLALLAALSAHCEGGHVMPMTVLVCYFLYERRIAMYAVFMALSAAPYLAELLNRGYLPTQFWMICAAPLMALSNGERGPSNAFSKYFFYIFYPLHVWIIVFIAYFTA